MYFIFTNNSNCSYCKKAQEFLSNYNQKFQYTWFDKDEEMQEYKDFVLEAFNKTFQTVPNILWLENIQEEFDIEKETIFEYLKRNKDNFKYIGGFYELQLDFIDRLDNQ